MKTVLLSLVYAVALVLILALNSSADQRRDCTMELFQKHHGLGFSKAGKTAEETADDHMACRLRALEVYPGGAYHMLDKWVETCMFVKGYELDRAVVDAKCEEIKAGE